MVPLFHLIRHWIECIILKLPCATFITPSNAGSGLSLIYSGRRKWDPLEERSTMQTESGMHANEMQQSGIYDAG